MSQVNGIHVVDQNILLGHYLFQFQSQILFLEFSTEFVHHGVFAGPFRKNVVLQKLLCNGTGTFGKTSVAKAGYTGTDDTHHVDTVVFIETFVLDCHKGICQVLGNLGHGNWDTVGIRRNQFCNLITLVVINKGGITGRGDINVAYIRSRSDDTLEHANACAGSNNDHCNESY